MFRIVIRDSEIEKHSVYQHTDIEKICQAWDDSQPLDIHNILEFERHFSAIRGKLVAEYESMYGWKIVAQRISLGARGQFVGFGQMTAAT